MAQRCDSCGMPLAKDPQGGGSEADGGKSTIYCSYCYADGDFIHKGVSAKEFQANALAAMKADGTPGWLAWLMTREIPRRPRWKQA